MIPSYVNTVRLVLYMHYCIAVINVEKMYSVKLANIVSYATFLSWNIPLKMDPLKGKCIYAGTFACTSCEPLSLLLNFW